MQPDLKKLAQYRVNLSDLKMALEQTNHNAGGGAVRSGESQLLLQAVGQFQNIEQVKKTPVKTLANFRNITIGDVADVTFAPAMRTGAALVDGKEAVLGTVMMLSGANSRTVAKAVGDRIREIQKSGELGADVEIIPLYDRSELVDATLKTVEHNLVVGAALVILILFFLLGNFKAALVVSISIPITLLGTFGFMQLFGISGNLMSLGALDFGIIVDAADRIPLSAATSARFPVGKIVSSTNSFCSATLIGPSEILTAAHCFLDPRTLEAKNPLPEFRIRDRDGFWHRASIKGLSSDRSINPLVHRGNDIATAMIDKPLGNVFGFMRVDMDADLAGLNEGVRTPIFLLGFHHDLDPEELYLSPSCFIHQFWRGSLLHHDCDLTAGASGGPVLHSPDGELEHAVVIAVQSAQYSLFGIENYDRYRPSVRNVGAVARRMSRFTARPGSSTWRAATLMLQAGSRTNLTSFQAPSFFHGGKDDAWKGLDENPDLVRRDSRCGKN
ncbi:MAG: efflux RND transporter permease subunit [Bdellovibrionaceae bacterium]|nr:efflux RND transporter permease subunit [Pseudobdellovibrionaceae bacterium]MBX3033975.1 efflux RND transporter permease subunit [Pseudobdellovibrionaceae bacterium]